MGRTKIIELTGKKFSRLTVIKLAYIKKNWGTFWLCRCDCGESCIVFGGSMRTGNTRSCGCLKKDLRKKMLGEKSPNWKGGRVIGKNGYVTLRMPDHPNAWPQGGRVPEHIYIMSKFLGRPLSKGELVHHKNGIRDDNRIENLELRTSRHPQGQLVEETIEFCIQYLQEYAPEVLVGNTRLRKGGENVEEDFS